MSIYIADSRLPHRFTQPGNLTTNQIIWDFDFQEVETGGLAIHVTALGTGGVITPEFSSNEVNWEPGWVERSGPNDVNVTAINATGMWLVPKLSRFIRLRASTASTAGTTTIWTTKCYADFRSGTATGVLAVGGQAAHDAVISGSPARIGVRGVTANYAPVANNDVADVIGTTVGAVIEKPFSIPEADWQFAGPAGGIITNTAVAAAVARAAGIRNYVTGLDVRNASATVATEFVVLDGATVIWRGQLPVNSGQVDMCFNTPLRGSAATALNVQALTTGAQVYVNVRGYQAP